jgi:hypothetical protein
MRVPKSLDRIRVDLRQVTRIETAVSIAMSALFEVVTATCEQHDLRITHKRSEAALRAYRDVAHQYRQDLERALDEHIKEEFK